MERFELFQQDALILASISLVVFVYFKVLKKYYAAKVESLTWVSENKIKAFFLIHVPFFLIYAPVFEELLFRLPLLIFFDEDFTAHTWVAVLLSGTIFAGIHWNKKRVLVGHILDAQKKGKLASDNIELAAEQVREGNQKTVLIMNIIQVVFTFFLGVLCAYFCIKQQSIWTAVWIHFAWNLIVVFVLPNVVLIVYALFLITITVTANAWDAITDKLYFSKSGRAFRRWWDSLYIFPRIILFLTMHKLSFKEEQSKSSKESPTQDFLK
jgi:membrane protease YdiL (CAAX protease family)